jgi:hypothetical protein
MARASVGGRLFSTVVSLLFLPTIYVWLDSMRSWPQHIARWIGWAFRYLAKGLAWPLRKWLGKTAATQAST